MNKFAVGALATLALAAIAVFAGQASFAPPDVKALTMIEKSTFGITVQVSEGPYFVSGTAALTEKI